MQCPKLPVWLGTKAALPRSNPKPPLNPLASPVSCCRDNSSMAAPGLFIWGYSPGVSPVGSRGKAPEGSREEVLQKLKQFADIVYRIWLQKRSKLKNFIQFTSWFLTSMFHDGGTKRHFWRGLSPLAHAWRRQCKSWIRNMHFGVVSDTSDI